MGPLLKTKKKLPPMNLLTLPAACVPSRESGSLTIKRAAQLEWMRAKGLQYLGDPRKRAQAANDAPAADSPVRLVGGARSQGEAAGRVRAAVNEG